MVQFDISLLPLFKTLGLEVYNFGLLLFNLCRFRSEGSRAGEVGMLATFDEIGRPGDKPSHMHHCFICMLPTWSQMSFLLARSVCNCIDPIPSHYWNVMFLSSQWCNEFGFLLSSLALLASRIRCAFGFVEVWAYVCLCEYVAVLEFHEWKYDLF